MDGNTPAESKGLNSLKQTANSSLRAVLGGFYAQSDVNELVSVCHSLALPYVRKRLSTDAVLKRTLDLNTFDFAFDCIADLFALAQSGEFPHFQAYFAAYPAERLSDEELLSHLRRLVFSHVNQGMFRLYNEVDPSLGKVIRNIKLAVQQFDSLVVVERFGEQCLAPSSGDRLIHERSMSLDELESGLRRYLKGSENVPFMLGKLALFLQEQTDWSRVVTLTSVAIAFRSIYVRHLELADSGNIRDDKMDLAYLSATIHDSVEQMKKRMGVQYSRKKRIRPGLLETYLNVVEKRLNLTLSGDGSEKGLRELLAEQLHGMSDAEYRSKHRSRLEYLSRLTGEEVARKLNSK